MIEALFGVLKEEEEERKYPSLNLVHVHKLTSFQN
jgi:hypothetical protein